MARVHDPLDEVVKLRHNLERMRETYDRQLTLLSMTAFGAGIVIASLAAMIRQVNPIWLVTLGVVLVVTTIALAIIPPSIDDE